MSSRAVVRLYYDIVSPYSFVAYHLLRRLRPVWGFDLVLEPIFLGFTLKTVGTLPPAFNKHKVAYFRHDIQRLKAIHKLDMKVMPEPFPTNTLKAMRLLHGIKTKGTPEALESVTTNLYAAYWTRGEDVTSADVLKACLPQGQEGDAYLKAMEDQAVKDQLVRASTLCVEQGVIGAPTIKIKREDGKEDVFFGSDRFDHIAWFLGKQLPTAKL